MFRHTYAVLLLPFLYLSCATKRPAYPVGTLIPPPAAATAWKEWKPGIDRMEWVQSNPPLRVWGARIDLWNPELTVVVTPGEVEEPQSGPNPEVIGRYTTSFARDYRTDLALNASPFYPMIFADRMPQSVAGLSISEGVMYSDPGERYAALLFRPRSGAGYQASVESPPFNLDGVTEAVGGFFMLLDDGESVAPAAEERYPMTLAGLDESGRWLHILTVDGRQPHWSVGMIPAEAALWLRWAGADDGLYFDGGGSTTLVLRTPDGRQTVVNRPVDARIIWKQRVVANHLGFRLQD